HSLIRNLEPPVDDGKRLAQLRLVDAERRVGEEGVPADEGVEALLAEEAAEGGHLLRGAVEGSQGLAGLAIANQLDDAEQSDGAHRADGWMLGLQFGEKLLQHSAHFFGVV